MELDENYEEPLESKDFKSPKCSMEKADLKRPKVFCDDLDPDSPSLSMEPSMKRRKKQWDAVALTSLNPSSSPKTVYTFLLKKSLALPYPECKKRKPGASFSPDSKIKQSLCPTRATLFFVKIG